MKNIFRLPLLCRKDKKSRATHEVLPGFSLIFTPARSFLPRENDGEQAERHVPIRCGSSKKILVNRVKVCYILR